MKLFLVTFSGPSGVLSEVHRSETEETMQGAIQARYETPGFNENGEYDHVDIDEIPVEGLAGLVISKEIPWVGRSEDSED